MKKLNLKVQVAQKVIRDLIAPKKELWPVKMFAKKYGNRKAAKAKVITMKTK